MVDIYKVRLHDNVYFIGYEQIQSSNVLRIVIDHTKTFIELENVLKTFKPEELYLNKQDAVNALKNQKQLVLKENIKSLYSNIMTCENKIHDLKEYIVKYNEEIKKLELQLEELTSE